MQLEKKVAIITGGTKGIGAATALLLARSGADVALVGRQHDAEASLVAETIEQVGRRSMMITADCGRADQCRRAVQATLDQFGRIDVLVHAAGGPVNGGLMDVGFDAWVEGFDVHVHAIYHLCRAIVPQMRQRKEGAIVLIGSTAGIRGVPTNVAYQVVKGCLPQFARALAREFADDNIRVNCVEPGIIRTRFHQHMTEEQKKNNLANRVPLHREGTSEQVATAIREMVTNDYITGQTLVVDGGLTMRIA